jgi:hypothetical protein
VGAIAMVLLIKLPFEFKIKRVSFRPAILTFLATLCSGYTFFFMLRLLILSGMEINFMALHVFNGIIIGTAAANAVIAFALYPALSLMVRRKASDKV